MTAFTNVASTRAVTGEMAWDERDVPVTVYGSLSRTADAHGDNKALSFQIFADAGAKAETLSWSELHREVTQAANLFRSLGVEEGDVVAMLMPNCNETAVALLGAMTAGIVNPINPLLEVEQIAGILNATGAKVLVTLKSFPKTDVAQKAAAAAGFASGVETVLEVDLLHYLTAPKSWIVPLMRPQTKPRHRARIRGFAEALAEQPADHLTFQDAAEDRIAAYFHTGGTTGMPKVAQHRYSGMIYNGWLGRELIFTPDDVLICPLPFFHCFATYPVLMSAMQSGAHVVLPTPAGYRGDGVFDNFWKLIERYGVTFLITVPTALSALMQRKVDADLSSLKTAISGSAPLPLELYRRFESATGVQVAEGYGLTECTCLVSCNPIEGEKRVGSAGIPLPYTDLRILHCQPDGTIERECETDEVGEICVSNPGVIAGSTYTEANKNEGLFADGTYLRTGDLGRIDPDGYLWITGRKKDLIIRGGHNIDPAEIEEALSGHSAVALVAAIGQPDARAGELPCAYVELVSGGSATPQELLDYARDRIHERAAVPKHIEILDEIPKTGIGKVFKPDLRRLAIRRVYNEALEEAGQGARVARVVEDKKLGLVAELEGRERSDEAEIETLLGNFTRPWRWAD